MKKWMKADGKWMKVEEKNGKSRWEMEESR